MAAKKLTPAAKLPSAPPELAPPQENLESALQLIKEFEGFVPHSYWDATGRVWTIGYGTTVYPDGKKVQKQQTCTRDQAVAFMLHDLQTLRLPAIEKLVKVPITNCELCALVSFAYNVGTGALAKSTLLKMLNAKQTKIRVADQFLSWTKSGGRVLSGLVRRRKAERELFLTEPIGEITQS
jgi:lysozyme